MCVPASLQALNVPYAGLERPLCWTPSGEDLMFERRTPKHSHFRVTSRRLLGRRCEPDVAIWEASGAVQAITPGKRRSLKLLAGWTLGVCSNCVARRRP